MCNSTATSAKGSKLAQAFSASRGNKQYQRPDPVPRDVLVALQVSHFTALSKQLCLVCMLLLFQCYNSTTVSKTLRDFLANADFNLGSGTLKTQALLNTPLNFLKPILFIIGKHYYCRMFHAFPN